MEAAEWLYEELEWGYELFFRTRRLRPHLLVRRSRDLDGDQSEDEKPGDTFNLSSQGRVSSDEMEERSK